jgi:hypothetical protein
MKIIGLSDTQQQEIQDLLNPKPTEPMYSSASKGLIPISKMHYNHRLAAAKKTVEKALEELYTLELSNLNQYFNDCRLSLSEASDKMGVLRVAMKTVSKDEEIVLVKDLLGVTHDDMIMANPLNQLQASDLEALYNQAIIELGKHV